MVMFSRCAVLFVALTLKASLSIPVPAVLRRRGAADHCPPPRAPPTTPRLLGSTPLARLTSPCRCRVQDGIMDLRSRQNRGGDVGEYRVGWCCRHQVRHSALHRAHSSLAGLTAVVCAGTRPLIMSPTPAHPTRARSHGRRRTAALFRCMSLHVRGLAWAIARGCSRGLTAVSACSAGAGGARVDRLAHRTAVRHLLRRHHPRTARGPPRPEPPRAAHPLVCSSTWPPAETRVVAEGGASGSAKHVQRRRGADCARRGLLRGRRARADPAQALESECDCGWGIFGLVPPPSAHRAAPPMRKSMKRSWAHQYVACQCLSPTGLPRIATPPAIIFFYKWPREKRAAAAAAGGMGYAAVATQHTRNVPLAAEMFCPPKTADTPSF